jgi:hypothetical protein
VANKPKKYDGKTLPPRRPKNNNVLIGDENESLGSSGAIKDSETVTPTPDPARPTYSIDGKKVSKEVFQKAAGIFSDGGLIPPNKRKGNIDYRKTGLVRNKRNNKRKGMK